MALNFFGYIEAPGEEFNLPGVLTSPLFGESALYPIWADYYEDLYWLSVRDGEMYVCPVSRDKFDEWDFDVDSSVWIGRHGELVSESNMNIGVETATDFVDGWAEVKLRCELAEKMNAPGA